MGHTVMPAVTTRFDGKAIFIDVGLGKYYGHHFSYLLVEIGEFFAMHRGTKVPLPANQRQALAYYEKLASLEPDPSALLRIIQRLKDSPSE
ncbi:MAG: hypothetical protein IH800_13965 [Myxococcales bacterium]|nr:hypothetical protein [Myxococcales bacterium]